MDAERAVAIAEVYADPIYNQRQPHPVPREVAEVLDWVVTWAPVVELAIAQHSAREACDSYPPRQVPYIVACQATDSATWSALDWHVR